METLVRVIGALAGLIVLLAVAALIGQAASPKSAGGGTLPHGLSAPALAMGFVGHEEVEAFLGVRDSDGDSAMRKQIRRGVYGDYVFIAMYWLLLMTMSALLALRRGVWAVWAGAAAAVCSTSAALFDVVENLSISVVLDATPLIQASEVRNVAAAGFGKWLSVSLSTLILSLVFLRRDWLALLGALYVLIAVGCVYGLLRNPRLVELSFLLNFAGLLAVAFVFSTWPQKVLRRL